MFARRFGAALLVLAAVMATTAIGVKAHADRQEDQVRLAAEMTYQAIRMFVAEDGSMPNSVMARTRTGHYFYEFLPHSRWLKNAYTSETTEPRDWSEMLEGQPVHGGVYVFYQETEAQCLIVGFGRKSKELYRRMY